MGGGEKGATDEKEGRKERHDGVSLGGRRERVTVRKGRLMKRKGGEVVFGER